MAAANAAREVAASISRANLAQQLAAAAKAAASHVVLGIAAVKQGGPVAAAKVPSAAAGASGAAAAVAQQQLQQASTAAMVGNAAAASQPASVVRATAAMKQQQQQKRRAGKDVGGQNDDEDKAAEEQGRIGSVQDQGGRDKDTVATMEAVERAAAWEEQAARLGAAAASNAVGLPWQQGGGSTSNGAHENSGSMLGSLAVWLCLAGLALAAAALLTGRAGNGGGAVGGAPSRAKAKLSFIHRQDSGGSSGAGTPSSATSTASASSLRAALLLHRASQPSTPAGVDGDMLVHKV